MMRPFLGPFDGRVADINRRMGDARATVEEYGAIMTEQVEELTREVGAYATTTTEANAYVGTEIHRFGESLERSEESLGTSLKTLLTSINEHERRVMARLDAIEGIRYVERLSHASEAPLEQLDGAVANLVNRAESHRGFAAQAGLWFNPAVNVELSEGSARLARINERIVELPFALGALARLKRPARILDIGSAESTFPLSAASLGYQVTALDLRPLPYSHPNLKCVTKRFENWDSGSERFDAAFLISTIEHFGLGAYGESASTGQADRAAVVRVGELLNDGGFMVLTTPYGPSRVGALERIYDERTLAGLLKGWTVIDRHTVLRRDDQVWMPGDSGEPDAQGVVMVVAVPGSGKPPVGCSCRP
jgi:hypothetical protein